MSELLEKILSRENMNEAYKRVKANKGTGGVDDMELEDLPEYIRGNWDSIKEQIRTRKYKPQPVRRVEIPKPDGNKRKLGIPTVMDRVIQQSIAQVISPMCEPQFSENSYGFRPNRSGEMAIKERLIFLNEGYEWIVDIELEKFFDNVPQDRLMSLVHNIIKYLGFGFYKDSKAKEWKCRPHTDSVNKFKRKLKNLTIRKHSMNFRKRIERINQVIRGWKLLLFRLNENSNE